MASKRKKVYSAKSAMKRKNKKIGSHPKRLDARGVDPKNGVGKIEFPETDFRALGDLGKW